MERILQWNGGDNMLFLAGLVENLVKLLMYAVVVVLGVLAGKKIRTVKDSKSKN